MMEYYSAIKYEILPFATTWIDLQSIAQSKISQRKINTIWFHSSVEFKKLSKWTKEKKRDKLKQQQQQQQLQNKQILNYIEKIVTRGEVGGGMGETGEGD